MPSGYQRLNEKKSQPNPNIVFIKPLKGADEKTAQDFLERIAAQCRPIMREHYLYVTSLEEFPPNREFVGRNFNAGEVIQLVLKSPRTGRWLPFNYVQMVMMHELAHCKQMNHSRAFWGVRDGYASQMQVLWSQGYTGDGLWGRGAALATGAWERDTVHADEVLPEHLCGGTFRSRRRKRKAKQQPALTYQERKERRILKKFGKNGVALGADDDVKVKLEGGRKTQAKPRVAGSMRGRELRAAAALARFGQQKEEEQDIIKKGEETESGSESEYEGDDALDPDSKGAVDVDGTLMVDEKGRSMVRVCEDDNADDPSAKNELSELQDLFRNVKGEPSDDHDLRSISAAGAPEKGTSQAARSPVSSRGKSKVKTEPLDERPRPEEAPATAASRSNDVRMASLEPSPTTPKAGSLSQNVGGNKNKQTCCPMCSFSNHGLVLACEVCGNVLDPSATPGSWKCPGQGCKDTAYRNLRDSGACGLCGRRRDEAA